MKKIEEYVSYFGGTFVQGYEELVDSGDVRESESLRRRCENLDRLRGWTNYCG